MAGLRTLLQIGSGAGGDIDYNELYIYNTNKTAVSNGGSVCEWTVPTGVSWFAVELWGGGGGGASACCCKQGASPGGSASYARKFVTGLSGTGGEVYTLCAAGSTGCSQNATTGCIGFPSFVSVSGGAVQVCASGGGSGQSKCFFGYGCSYSGCPQSQCGSWTGTFGICGTTGSGKGSSFCHNSSWNWMPSAPYTAGGNRGTRNHCTRCQGCGMGGYAHWPGGGGASVSEHSGANAFYGAAGSGGLITIYYPVVSQET